MMGGRVYSADEVEKRYGTRYIDSVIVERNSVKDLNA